MDVLLSLLITLLILAVVFWVVQYIIGLLGMPEPIGKIVQVIFILVALLLLLRVVGVWGPGPYLYWRHA